MYLFKVTRDHLEPDSQVTLGYRGYGMTPADKAGFEKITMTIYDDDDVCYFTVDYWGDEDEESIFAPLDWAGYYAGATKCKINGEWL